MSSPDDPCGPDGASPPDVVANELFVHGLLESLRDDAHGHQRRVAAVMAAIDAGPVRPPRPLLPWLLTGIGAAAAVLVVVLLVIASSAPDAVDVVDRAVRAAAQAGPRRYRLEATGSVADTDFAMKGELDVHGDDHVVRAHVHGAPVAAGVDRGEPWFLGDDVLAEHLRSLRRSGHGAFALDDKSLTLGSVDGFVARLAANYRLEPPTLAPLPAGSAGSASPAGTFQRVGGERIAPGRLPDRVELWIDPGSGLVQRLAVAWPAGLGTRPPPASTERDPHSGHRVVLDLVGPVDLPPDWFQAARHR